jgi:hypothetical protein
MDVRLPDGTLIKDVPDGTTKAELASKLKANGMAVPAEWLASAPQKPASVSAGEGLRSLPRQLIGLPLRYGIEGAMAIPGMLVDAGTGTLNALADAAGLGGGRFQQSGVALSNALTRIGLPEPQNADERVIGDATRTMAGAGGLAIGAKTVAANLAPGAAKTAATSMAARPVVQMAGGATAGGAGGSVREAGGGPFEQFAASLAGGIGGGLAADKIGKGAAAAGTAVKNALTPKAVELQRADQQISMILERGGVDWSQVPERIKQSMRDEVAAALNTGQPLNAEALNRLLVFKRANVTPTVGQLTQDPGMLTREKNLAKTGANSTSPALQKLPMLENQNVASLLRQLDEAGAARAPNASGAGMAAINSLDSTVARETAATSALYRAARDTSGRSLPLEGGTFTQRANELLDAANVGSFLPKDIANKMNAIARGEYPLTVDVAEQLKTSIGNLQRGSSDGNMRTALGLVRQALDEAPLQNGRTFNPGNVPAVAGTVPPSTAAAGEESIAAFNAARQSHRSWMRRVEGNPALRAVVDGVEPDQFVQRFVISKSSPAANVQSLRNELDPQAVQQMRSYLVRYLKDAATGGDQDIVKFAGKTYRDALRNLGDEKLSVFFDKDEIQKLKDLGDAAKYMQAQPAGSAVNNSNSGALLIGRGLDMLEQAAQKVPLARDVLTGLIQGQQQRQVMAPRNALSLAAQPQMQGVRVNPLVAASVQDPRQDKRRD